MVPKMAGQLPGGLALRLRQMPLAMPNSGGAAKLELPPTWSPKVCIAWECHEKAPEHSGDGSGSAKP